MNNAVNFIRKNKNIPYADAGVEEIAEFNVEETFSEMLDGYRLIFNLYVFEDKKHHEIAEILNISEGTSKSQLSRYKKWIVDFLTKRKDEKKYAE